MMTDVKSSLGERPAPSVIKQRRLTAKDRTAIANLLSSLPAFTDDERDVALELVDATLARPDVDEYRFILSVAETASARRDRERLAGYLCYGRTPMTQSTYDLYWVATSPDFTRSGIASGLVASMEAEITREGGGIIRVETGSREGHGAAVHFYDALGFERSAVIADFYAPGDDLLIFTKRVSGARASSFSNMDDPSLYDAAFGYRDYKLERDFLLACAGTFGKREVRRVLGWACGPARHLSSFADIGIAGVGADASAPMIAHARRIAGPRADITFVEADLDEEVSVSPVDLSFVPLSAIHQLLTPEAIETHLRLAASLLRPGGVHIIEATHPGDLTPVGVHHTEWTEVRGDVVVDARFRIHIERATPNRVVPTTLEVFCAAKNDIATPANGNGSHTNKAEAAPESAKSWLRQENDWYIPELEDWQRMIARVPELTLVATLGDFNVEVPFDHSAAWRLILVLKRS